MTALTRKLRLEEACHPAYNRIRAIKVSIAIAILGVSEGGFWLAIRNKKNTPKRKFSGWISRGRPGVFRADVSGQKLQACPGNL